MRLGAYLVKNAKYTADDFKSIDKDKAPAVAERLNDIARNIKNMKKNSCPEKLAIDLSNTKDVTEALQNDGTVWNFSGKKEAVSTNNPAVSTEAPKNPHAKLDAFMTGSAETLDGSTFSKEDARAYIQELMNNYEATPKAKELSKKLSESQAAAKAAQERLKEANKNLDNVMNGNSANSKKMNYGAIAVGAIGAGAAIGLGTMIYRLRKEKKEREKSESVKMATMTEPRFMAVRGDIKLEKKGIHTGLIPFENANAVSSSNDATRFFKKEEEITQHGNAPTYTPGN